MFPYPYDPHDAGECCYEAEGSRDTDCAESETAFYSLRLHSRLLQYHRRRGSVVYFRWVLEKFSFYEELFELNWFK